MSSDTSKQFPSITASKKTACGDIYLTLVSFSNGRLFKVYPSLGKAGTCQTCFLNTLGDFVALAIELGASKDRVLKRLKGQGCTNTLLVAENDITASCVDAMGKMIEKYYKEPEEEKK